MNNREDYRNYCEVDRSWDGETLFTPSGHWYSGRSAMAELASHRTITKVLVRECGGARTHEGTVTWEGDRCIVTYNGRKMVGDPFRYTYDQARALWEAADKLAHLLRLMGMEVSYDDRPIYKAAVETVGEDGETYHDEVVVAYGAKPQNEAWLTAHPVEWKLMQVHDSLWDEYDACNRVY